MTCPACQHDNRAAARFCENCGAPLGRRCAHCGGALAAAANFCPDCGRSAAASPAAPAHFGAPETYTPRHLAERILTSKAALEGERKQITVLFADVKGSMELIADRDPEAARKILDPVLQLMMDAVHRYEGTVNQVMGDGIMALFGAPLALEDHAVRACFAALQIQEAARRQTAETRRAHGVEIQVRVGLNSGEVVVRSIGSDLRMDYTAVGGTTHLAARMEQLASPGAIRLTADTFRLAEGFVQVNDLGPVPVKGVDAPVEVYELTAASEARTRLQAATARGLSRFVGREAEMQQLGGALEQARRGRGEVVAVVGEPGVGKSRLLHELIHSPRGRGCLILETRALSYGRATAYLPVADLLKAYLRVDEADDARAIRARVTGHLLTLDETLGDAIPPVLWLLDALPAGDSFRSLAPPQRRQRALDAVKRVLLRESRVQPLVLVFEDLHWIDGETQAVLDGLVDGLPTAAALLLVNYRPEYRHDWAGRTYYRQLRIDPLPPETSEELLRSLVGDGEDLAPLKGLLVGRTEGNPLFLEESVRTLVETGTLAGERGAYRLTRPVDHLHIPASVQAILAARIDRLGPEDKRLLQAAAVIGKDVPLPLLLAVADASESEVRGALGRLQAAEFLHETRLFPELEHTFKHALTHEVAYASLLHERRRELHARIARAIEGLTPEGRAEQLERLAHHTFHGELWPQAVTALREAGFRALARSAHREAIIHLERALTALSHLADSAETRALAIDLRLDLAPPLSGLARYGELRQRMLEAEPLAEASGDRIRLGRVLLRLSQAVRMFGDYAGATDAGQRAVAVAEATGDAALLSETLHRLGQIHLGVGDSARAIDLLRRAVAVLGELGGSADPSGFIRGVGAHAWLGYALGYRGDFAEAIACGRHALRLGESGGRPGNRLAALGTLGLTFVEQGDFAEAIRALEGALGICETSAILDWSITVESALGVACALAGRFEEALALQRRAQAEEPHAPQGFPAARILRFGETCWLAGRLDEARALAVQGLELARAAGERGGQVRAWRLLGDVAAAGDGPDAEGSEHAFRQALALADELGMRPQAARCHLGLGVRYGRAGRPREAQEHLARARAMFSDMAMSHWMERTHRALSALGESSGR
jgi:class 3 adenylate cyclase/tetratricopeptide (TPR) repeat protein